MTLEAAAPLGGHAVHLLESVAFFAVAIAAVGIGEAIQRRRAHPPADRTHARRERDLSLVVAAGAVTAGLVHLVVLPVHLRESLLYGAFFAATAAAQIGWALLILMRPSRRLLTLGAAANAAVVVLWLVTRTVGIPLGPSAGEVESVSGLDLLATAAELAVVGSAVYTLVRAQLPSPRRLSTLARRGALVPLMVGVAVTVSAAAYVAPPS